ncbi:DUF350 domain-containing protein [Patescibacteria group bacterium]
MKIKVYLKIFITGGIFMNPMFQGMILLIASMAILWVLKTVFNWITPYDDDFMIEESSSWSAAFPKVGLYTGFAIGLCGALTGFDPDEFWLSLSVFIWDAALIAVFMIGGGALTVNLIIPSINRHHEIGKGNVAVGIIELGTYISIGFISYASLIGIGGPWWSSIVYFILGQTTIILASFIYEIATSFDVVDDVRKGNVAAGVLIAGIMIAMSIVLKSAIAGPFNGWVVDIIDFAKCAVYGIILILVVCSKFVDHVFFSGTDIKTEVERDQNTPALLVVASVKITMAIVIGAVITELI